MEYVYGVVILLLILVLAYYTTKLVAKASLGSGKSKYMQVVDRLTLDRTHQIVIVEINGENQVLVVGEHSVENLGVVGDLESLPQDNNKSFDMSFLKAIQKTKRDEE